MNNPKKRKGSIVVPPPVQRLLAEAEVHWRELGADFVKGWQGFVPADYPEVYLALKKLRASGAETFLEWGSGIGTVAIMADMLGYEAYGIEIQPALVARAEALAARFGSKAVFAEGNFIPDDYRWSPEVADEDFNTSFEGGSGYEELGMELGDFDVVYGYPWPGEEALFEDIFDRHARPDAVFVSYHSLDHVLLHRVPRKIAKRRLERDRER
jgi:hypothetical protein